MRTDALSPGKLNGTRVYLSGPIGFLGSRQHEVKFGWRSRLTSFLREMGLVVYDPLVKPRVAWFYDYGDETQHYKRLKEKWTFGVGTEARRRRAECGGEFKRTMHIDLRMVDTSDFVIAYCPKGVYSVGTVHEVVLASQEHKPVLLVSPRVDQNPEGIPSSWYMALLNESSFFDGFGFAAYSRRFKWSAHPIEHDAQEQRLVPRRPLLPYLTQLNSGKSPKRFDPRMGRTAPDYDWLLLREAQPAQGHVVSRALGRR